MKQRPVKSGYAIAGLAVTLALLPDSQNAYAQTVARVAALERVTEKKNDEGSPWVKAKIGTDLTTENRFRTRKRSKADILFADKSLIRLGALSTLYVQNATDVKLTEGQLLFSRLTPGRVVAGAGIAGIKGSVGVIQINDDGSTLFSLISGAMDVDTIRGDHITLQPGQSVLVSADGAISALRIAAPLISSGTGNYGTGGSGGLGQAPVDSPYAGSNANLGVRSTPERISADQGNTAGNSVVAQNSNPFQQRTGVGLPNDPPIDVFPAAQRTAAATAFGPMVAALQAPTGTTSPAIPVVNALDTSPAGRHIEDALGNLGPSGFTDVEIIGALGDGGTQVYGGRLHTYMSEGPWSMDVALLPLKLRDNTSTGRTTRDISALSSATIKYSGPRAEVEIGRQRFLAGPTQAALFGSMVRQGARDTMDAVRLSPNIGTGRSLDLAYLYDAFPRNLPYQVPGRQKGYYGRAGLQTSRGNFGLNLLHYTNLNVSNTTGASVDFAMPIVRNEVEFYGEFGRDPFRRGMLTTGLTFPGLYDRTDFDVYLETVNMRRWGGTSSIPPTEYSARVYRRVGKNSNFVLQLQKFHKSESSVTIGFSYGARFLSPRG